MVRRLVAVRVLSHQSGDVRLLAPGKLRRSCEQFVETFDVLAGSAHQVQHALNVVRNKERVLPGIALREMESHFLWRERLYETAVLFRPEKSGFGIEKV